MATRLTGALGPFVQEKMQWTSYAERMEEYLLANGVDDARKKVAVLLSTVGEPTYELLRDLCSPEKPNTKSFDDLVTLLTGHLQPKPTVIAERYKFHQRNQLSGETVTAYIAELRKLAKTCDYAEFLEQALRDKFVCGLASEDIKKELLKEKELTFTKACATAISMEAAAKDSSLMGETKDSGVHHLRERKQRKGKAPPRSDKSECHRCGKKGHDPSQCRFIQATCHNCQGRGHIKAACWSKKKAVPKSQRQKVISDEDDDDNDLLAQINLVRNPKVQDKAFIGVSINGQRVDMEIDTGAAVTVMPEGSVKVKLQPTQKKLRSATGQLLELAGEAKVQVKVGKIKKTLILYVTKRKCPALFGRSWIRVFFGNDWHKKLTKSWMNTIQEQHSSLQQTLHRYADTVFKPGLGRLKTIKAHLQLKSSVSPKFYKPRMVPFALRPKLEETLKKMEAEGNLEKVKYSPWGTPVVPVLKPDGTVRVCGDFKVTLNPCLEVQKHPLPRVEECFHAMNGGEKFTKIDLAQAYNQVPLDDESKELTTLNTHKGLYRWSRLPYGVASSPAIFQGIMDQILQGLNHVVWYLDDILLTGESEAEHLSNLEEVLSRLEKFGLRARLSKCQFFQDSVEYLGHKIDKEGIHTLKKKVEALTKAKTPQNIEQLQSFLGMVNYYGKFIPNLSTISAPLNRLRQKEVPWQWTEKEDEAVNKLKDHLSSAKVLVHYNPKLPLKLDCDASSVGIGAVLSHVQSDGTEKPIAYASRSLTKAERNYSQIEREALSIIWGIKKFHNYLYLNTFTLITDHKPLTTIFNPSKALPSVASARIQRWAIFLMSYQYVIQYRSTTKHGNADALSRLPMEVHEEESKINIIAQLQLNQLEEIHISAEDVATQTRQDPILQRVAQYVKTGWPRNCKDPEILPYFRCRNEFSVESDCLMRGVKVTIPPNLQQQILKLLHETHPGMIRTKALARSYVWWPGITESIEQMIQRCEECQKHHREEPATPLQPLEVTAGPWQRVHIDFAGPFQNRMWLILVDSYSKWPEVVPMQSTTAKRTIEELRQIFARFGLPNKIVSDNGPQFVSEEFREFVDSNGIKHVRVAPYHPKSNGQAERFVQTFKAAMRKMANEEGDVNQKLSNFLLTYRKTPQSTTQEAPAMLLMKRIPCSRIDLLRPNVAQKIREKQEVQKKHHDKHTKAKEFSVSEPVWVRDYRGQDKWTQGVIKERTSSLSYRVQVQNEVWKRHAEQIRHRTDTSDGDVSTDAPELVQIPLPQRQPNTDDPVPRRQSCRSHEPPSRLTYSRPGVQTELTD